MGYLNLVVTILITMVSTPLIRGDEASSLSSLVIAPNCTSTCGGITIPYPFGIEEGCYYKDTDNRTMRITCNHTFNPPKPIWGTNYPMLEISVNEAEILLNNLIAFNCYNPSLSRNKKSTLGRLKMSTTKNKFVATGCDTYAWFTGERSGKEYFTGCMTKCKQLDDVGDECNGVGCCEVSIPDGVTNIHVEVESFYNHTSVGFNPCSAAYPVANQFFTFSKNDLTRNLSYYKGKPLVPVVYDWRIGNQSCSEAKKDGSCLCKNNTECKDLPDLDGYHCDCNQGYSGNPYLPQGCQDIDECTGANECEKPEYCINTDGSYICECPKGYHGNGTRTDGCISSSKAWLIPVIIKL